MDREPKKIQESPWAERLNSITHGFGWALSIAALVVMVVFAALKGTARHVVGTSIFGATMVLLYAMSTLYHAFRGPRVKKVFRILDHSAIFLLIAGTYTPFCLTVLRGPWGWTLFGIAWGLAVAGIVFKSVAGPRNKALSMCLYLAMGWLVLIAVIPLWRALPAWGLVWLFGGGCCYSLGTVFYAWKRLWFNHAVWHMFVIAGSACHVVTVMAFLIPWN